MLKAAAQHLRDQGITVPTLLILEERARANIRRMRDRARDAGVVLRPHFKTHQNPNVAEWFREAGIDRITVSSLAMARRFAALGWNDITLAFLLNPADLPAVSDLAVRLAARSGRLSVTLDSPLTARKVADCGLAADIWLKVDTGYGRTGIPGDQTPELQEVVRALGRTPRGLLAHAGHGYHARSRPALQNLWDETRQRLHAAAAGLGMENLALSVGDTPTCTTARDLGEVDEIRPGNFVYGDLMQVRIGSMNLAELAAAVACPVVGVYPARGQVVVHGGAVHLSKERLDTPDGPIFGRPGTLDPAWSCPGAAVTSLSQEHGVISFGAGFAPQAGRLVPGDVLPVWPVHSCLAADLLECRPEPSVHILS